MNSDIQKSDSDVVQKYEIRTAGKIDTKKEPQAAYINEVEELMKGIAEVKAEWQDACTKFDYVHDEKLVDYYTYKLKACEARYSYYLNKAKEKGIFSHRYHK